MGANGLAFRHDDQPFGGDMQADAAVRKAGRNAVNVAAVAMANKLARIAWALLTKGERYRARALAGA